jgi:hypothetical protein
MYLGSGFMSLSALAAQAAPNNAAAAKTLIECFMVLAAMLAPRRPDERHSAGPFCLKRYFLSMVVVVDDPVVASSVQAFVVFMRSSANCRDVNASGPIWAMVVCSVGWVVVTVQ